MYETNIVVNLENDDFAENLDGLAFILRQLADNIDRGNLPMDTMWIMDRNGNKVGTWKLGEKVSLSPWTVKGE